MLGNKKEVILLDFSSETNIGDIALQSGLIGLLREHFPDTILSVTTIFGANQLTERNLHFRELNKYPEIHVVGALRPTFYPMEQKSFNIHVFELLNVLGLISGFLLLTILRVGGNHAKKVMPQKYCSTWDLIGNAELVIWKGKNFRNTHWLIEPYRVLSRLFMPIACLICRKPMVCVGLSVWPLNNRLSVFFLKAVLKRCLHVSARETYSYEEINRLLNDSGPKPLVSLSPDLSFAVLRDYEPKTAGGDGNNPVVIALTVVDWKGFGVERRDNYITALVEFIEYSVKKYNAGILFVPQVVKEWESSDYVVDEIMARVDDNTREHITQSEVKHGVQGVIEIYRQSDFLIATRMHSAIFALSVGTPVLAIPYDTGAKWGILSDLGYSNYMIDYDLMDGERFIALFEQLKQNRQTIMDNVQNQVKEQMGRVDETVLGFRQLIEQN